MSATLLVGACSSQPAVSPPKNAAAKPAADAGSVDVLATAVPIFAATARPAGTAGYVELEGEWHADRGVAEVRVFVGGFASLFGIAGHFRYDPEALQLVLVDMKPVPIGSASDADTWTARSVGKDSPAGRILMGGARLPLAPSPYLSLAGAKVGRELWMVAEFRVLKAGDWQLGFDPTSQVARGDDGKELPTWWGVATLSATAEAIALAQPAVAP